MGKLEDSQGFIVTIDGPAASGKSTTARRVAEILGWLYLDTGAMYRSMAVKVVRAGVSLEEEEAISKLAEATQIELIPDTSGTHVRLDGKDVTNAIRTPEIDRAVGPVCEIPRVREILVEQQRRIGAKGNLVAEGRDMGTVVFPDAELKFFMIASIEARAERRRKDMAAQGIEVDVGALKTEIARRDARDSNRSHSPLKKAEDAILINTTVMDVDAQVEFVIEHVRLRGGITSETGSTANEKGNRGSAI